MTRILRAIVVLAAAAAAVLTAVATAADYAVPIDRVAGLAAASEGRTCLALYEGDAIKIRLVDAEGVMRASASLPRVRDGHLYAVADMDVDAEGVLYLLCDLSDPESGEYQGQELSLYDPSALFRKRLARHQFDPQLPIRYRWLNVQSSLVLMAVDQSGNALIREAYDPASLYGRQPPAPMGTRNYPLDAEEGIWEAVIAGSDVAYATKSGKVFLTAEGGGDPVEVYPNRVLTELMYPLFLAPQGADEIYIGEQESGDLLSLGLRDGGTALLKSGTEPFSGVSGYTPGSLRAVSMTDPQNFSALAPNADGFALITSQDGEVTAAESLRPSLGGLALKVLWTFLRYLALLLAAMLLVYGFIHLLGRGRTILAKLILSSIPLLAVALVVFGVFSYRAYSAAITQSFQKQVEDEGNLLTALFGTESFDEIEYPYDYTGEAYGYLRQQMSTRPVHTATAYYEHQQLYIGVDFENPCFYPFDVRLDAGARELYLQAAYTGRAQSGVLDDENGRRLVSVTPVGGTSGTAVYLLEAGILTSNLDAYTASYLRTYVVVSLLFLAAIGALLTFLFRRVLTPIRQIRAGLEAFAQGNRTVRLETAVTDEFSGIVRVFNKMAGDIDAQLYSLRRQSETYFRFIPQRMLQLLGKDNLGEVELGSGSGRECPVLCADLEFSADGLSPEREQELTNRFFNLLNRAADRCGATLMTDSVNLHRLRVICPGGAADAVEIALAVLTEVENLNVGLPIKNRLRPLLFIHSTRVYYGICGDENRLVPALLSGDLDDLSGGAAKLRQFGCRLLVTRAAFEELPADHRYVSRFIGYPEGKRRQNYGLYDFYDAAAPEVTRLLTETRPTFDKAMALYLEGRFPEAKNLFALVLRENQYDDAARYYVFRCEQEL